MILGVSKIILLLLKYRYLFLFPIAVFEGPIISVLAGFMVAQNVFGFWMVILILVLGDAVGDTLYYCIGRYGGHPVIRRWGKYLKITETNFEETKRKFHDHTTSILLFGKSQPLGSVILFAAGVLKVPYVKFIILNFVGTILKSFILVGIGYYFGEAYILLDQYGNYFLFGFTALSLLIIFIIYKWKKLLS